ncbi:TetR/AcrR family transcriptional regulator [Cytobacillus sp. FJAT-53684]|uniref:TetR/AcrR family transcriptional regulator n=1 Tax=Cytobacillus mangrovibacter TaxID=3299024 RepID=A0ABW6JZ18_9BACI
MPPSVSEKYKEEKKRNIINSALICFAEKGFETATIDDIVVHSGFSKGTIYNYFSSKDEIYLEVLHTATKNDIDVITNKFSVLRTALSKINYLFDLYLNIDLNNQKRLGFTVVFYEFTLHCTREKKLLELLTKRRNFFIHLISEAIKEGQASGEFNKNIQADTYSHLFWTIIDGINLQVVYKGFPYYDVLREMKEAYIEKLKN